MPPWKSYWKNSLKDPVPSYCLNPVRLVADEDAEALRRKREALSWRPEGGFLRDQQEARPRVATPRATPAG